MIACEIASVTRGVGRCSGPCAPTFESCHLTREIWVEEVGPLGRAPVGFADSVVRVRRKTKSFRGSRAISARRSYSNSYVFLQQTLSHDGRRVFVDADLSATTRAAQSAILGQSRPLPSTSAPPASPPPSPPSELSPSSPRATAVGRWRHSSMPPCQ